MYLVDSYVFKRVRVVAPPDTRIMRTHKQVVEHLVVGQQNVGRILDHGIAIGNDVAFAHHTHAFAPSEPAHVQARRHVVAKLVVAIDELGDTLSLIGCQGVHGVYDERLDALFVPMPIAVVDQRI